MADGCTPYTISSELTLKQALASLQPGGIVRLMPIDVGSIPRIDPGHAAAIKQAANRNWGWVLPLLIADIFHERSGGEREFQEHASSYSRFLPGHDAPGYYRASRSFGAMWAAGELLKAFSHVVPAHADVAAVIKWAWANWKKEMDTLSAAGGSLDRAVEHLRNWISAGGHGRLYSLEGSGGVGPAWGWRGTDGTIYVRSDKIAQAAGGRVTRQELVGFLSDKGLLILPSNPAKNVAWSKVPGHGNIQNYPLRETALG